MLFPTVQGSSLAGRQFVLPRDFAGRPNVVLIPFEIEHQAEVDTWIPHVKQLADRYPDLRYYELPTLWTMSPVQRWWVDSGMRMGIRDQKTRELTITLYLDRRAFLRALDLPHDDTAYVLLVDGAGEVTWRTAGRWTEQEGRSLIGALEGSTGRVGMQPRVGWL